MDSQSIELTSLIPLFTFVLGIIANELLSSQREKRQTKREINANFSNLLEMNYLGEEIKSHRNEIEQAGGINHNLEPTNVHSYKLTLSLQQAGVNCLLSASTLNFLLFNAPQIVRDWVLVADHINNLRSTNLWTLDTIPFRRRHGEWLALMAYIWLKSKKYELPEMYQDAILEFQEMYRSEKTILDKEKLLYTTDNQLSSSYIKDLRNTSRKKMIKLIKSQNT